MSRGQRAGIAQLVEQATENRRVPSSNLGPGILLNRSLIPIPVNDDRQFNNADGFAMAFDPAWKQCCQRGELTDQSLEERIETVINHLGDHPFVQSEPEQARQVAMFRVRLLDLEGHC